MDGIQKPPILTEMSSLWEHSREERCAPLCFGIEGAVNWFDGRSALIPALCLAIRFLHPCLSACTMPSLRHDIVCSLHGNLNIYRSETARRWEASLDNPVVELDAEACRRNKYSGAPSNGGSGRALNEQESPQARPLLICTLIGWRSPSRLHLISRSYPHPTPRSPRPHLSLCPPLSLSLSLSMQISHRLWLCVALAL